MEKETKRDRGMSRKKADHDVDEVLQEGMKDGLKRVLNKDENDG